MAKAGRDRPRLAENGRGRPRLAGVGRDWPGLAEIGRDWPRWAEIGRGCPEIRRERPSLASFCVGTLSRCLTSLTLGFRFREIHSCTPRGDALVRALGTVGGTPWDSEEEGRQCVRLVTAFDTSEEEVAAAVGALEAALRGE